MEEYFSLPIKEYYTKLYSILYVPAPKTKLAIKDEDFWGIFQEVPFFILGIK